MTAFSSLRPSLRAAALALLTACAAPPVAPVDGGVDARPPPPIDAYVAPDVYVAVDAPPDAPPLPCEVDLDCANGTYCDGVERCAPLDPVADARGCAPATSARCRPEQTCDELAATCITRCAVEPDADGDGRDAIECGGDDCDDADATRAPGFAETCDGGGHDEDCDPTTFGDRDDDADGSIDALCCNVVPGGAALCGDDCDDTDAARHPGADERCDGLDDDCDGEVDGARAALACTVPAARAACSAGACVVGACQAGRADCNGLAADGCEVDLGSDAAHCGSCAASCGARACDGGRCAGSVDRVVSVEAGTGHTCALYASGTVRCWGHNEYGELGDGTLVDRLRPVPVIGIYDATSLALGGLFGPVGWSCARRAGGEIRCWGPASWLGTAESDPRPYADAVPALAPMAGVATSFGDYSGHSCAWAADGAVRCWNSTADSGGGTGVGALGPGSPTDAPAGVTPAVEVAAGMRHTCVRRADGTARCWGDNNSGQCGAGTGETRHSTAVAVTGIADAVQIDAGRLHTCVVRDGGSVACWGFNFSGQLGDGTSIQRATPVAVVGLTDAAEVGAGYTFTCARRTNGHVVCWGDAMRGELGEGSPSYISRRTPMVEVSGLTDAVDLTVGQSHACALRATGSVVCWGTNDTGQLGDGTRTHRSRPVSVAGL